MTQTSDADELTRADIEAASEAAAAVMPEGVKAQVAHSLKALGFKLSPKQKTVRKVLGGPETHCLVYGGSRSGKTFLLVYCVVIRALRASGSRHLICRKATKHVKTSIFLDTFPKVMRLAFPGIGYKENKSDLYVTFPNSAEIWFGGLDDKERVEKILGQEYCVDPDSKVLTSDLRWVRAADVEVGRELIGFPEDLEGHCTLEPSTVTRAEIIQANKCRVVTDRGETIVSMQHKFVAHHDDRRHRNFRLFSWRSIDQLKVGDRIRFCETPWAEGVDRAAGWMAGMFDGEGWASEAAGQVGVAQRRGVVLDAMKQWLTENGVQFGEYESQGPNSGLPCMQLRMKGIWPSLRALGIARPLRLNARPLWEGRRAFINRRGGVHEATILRIEPLGIGPVVSMSTTTATLIADGFLGHNCTVYVNECSQLSYDAVVMLRSRLAQNCVCDDGKPLKLKAYYDLNPTGKSHWTYKEFVDGVDPKSGKPLKTGRRIFGTINPRENPHLPTQYVDEILEDMPERQRQRFLDGKFINEVPGALWKLDDLEEHRLDADAYNLERGTIERGGAVISLKRIVVAVDPMVAKVADGEAWDLGECGIVVAALGDDDRAYILADGSERLSPDGWAAKAIALYHGHRADRIVAEKNNGGEMVRLTIATADATKNVPIELVNASRGKIPRAEPVSVLYAKGRVSHVGVFPGLEDQMTCYTGAPGENSPDRMDALVWALTELKLAPEVPEPFID